MVCYFNLKIRMNTVTMNEKEMRNWAKNKREVLNIQKVAAKLN